MPLTKRRTTKHKKDRRRKTLGRRKSIHRRGGSIPPTVSLQGQTMNVNEFKKRVENGTLSNSVNPLD